MQRPIRDVPLLAWALIGTALGVQFMVPPAPAPETRQAAGQLPAKWIRIASLGEGEAASALASLSAQNADAGKHWRDLDYAALVATLETAQQLDPRSPYPLTLATGVYSATPNSAGRRALSAFAQTHHGGMQ